MSATGRFSRVLTMTFAVVAASSAFGAEEGAWSVGKSSGEVWMTASGAQQVSLGKENILKPGDTIRTGRTGRVLLVRGEETILISPNSVIGLPAEKKEGLSTTIVQQAGSILLEVEKRNVKHFEVETPYLAAVVKGTQFRVTVNAASTSIDVIRGQVEVADFRSGQIAQVMPGQHATSFARGNPGLSLSGAGTLSPIEHGRPRASTIERIPVPKTGFTAPRHASNGQSVRALSHGDRTVTRAAASTPRQSQAHASSPRHGVTRISSSLGEVRVNFHKVTHGLARGPASIAGSARSAGNRDTVWSSRETGSSNANASSQGNSNEAASNGGGATATSATAASGVTAAVAAVTGPGNSGGNGGGNGNGGNGNGGNGNGANGNGGGNNGNNGNGNGNNGNGNNGNNGNGNGRGHR
jgi:hypothetical protein